MKTVSLVQPNTTDLERLLLLVKPKEEEKTSVTNPNEIRRRFNSAKEATHKILYGEAKG